MKNKYLYKFTVPKIEDVEVVETRKENDQEIKVTKKIKKIVEKKFSILNPRRSMLEEGEMFYACKVSEHIKNGLLPQAVLARKVNLDNGVLEDDKRESELRDKAITIADKADDLTKQISKLEYPKTILSNDDRLFAKQFAYSRQPRNVKSVCEKNGQF